MKKKTEDLSFMKTSNEYTKIGKLSFEKGSVALFAVSELHKE
jgi:hypothetical protein